ncbi:MAG TPA: IMP dehydrogenase [Candidatus Kapabacteria bacterium]|nr:IMP dehydrogenase [Candidatus Kapabacteria bacterium]
MNHPKIAFEGITYDDVLLIPAYSEVLPRETNVSTRLTKNISLNIPLVSAAMDTVTDAQMAIAIAREGGIGVIHKNLSIAAQAAEVDKVKRSESGMIKNPITLTKSKNVADALELMAKYHISGIPVVDENMTLIGIITNRDLRFKPNKNQLISEIMTNDGLITLPEGSTLDDAEKVLQNYRIEKLPVVDENNKLKGLITFKDIQKKKKHPYSCKDELGRLRVSAAVGIAYDTMERVDALVAAGVDAIFVDTAHGHHIGVLKMVAKIREKYSNISLIGGNIATGEAAKALIDSGVDAVKIGIGPGSICTTRIIAGVGVPQLSAIINVVEETSKYNIPVIADGGVKQTGDIAKAIAAGADSVMIGNLFAGHEESPGERIIYERRAYKIYRGMGSEGAMKQGSADRYFQDVEDEISKYVPEGIEGRIPFKGAVSDTIYQLVGGLRAAMGYCGCKTIDEMKTKTKFNRITNAGLRESHPHNVSITQESPNYYV